MTRNKLAKVRRLATALVLGNLALVALLGLVLPESAHALLPIAALTLPLLSAAGIEEALKREPADRANSRAARDCPQRRGSHAHAARALHPAT